MILIKSFIRRVCTAWSDKDLDKTVNWKISISTLKLWGTSAVRANSLETLTDFEKQYNLLSDFLLSQDSSNRSHGPLFILTWRRVVECHSASLNIHCIQVRILRVGVVSILLSWTNFWTESYWIKIYAETKPKLYYLHRYSSQKLPTFRFVSLWTGKFAEIVSTSWCC